MSNSTIIEQKNEERLGFSDNQVETIVETRIIPKWLYDKLDLLGIIPNKTRSFNEGASDYSKHIIQPWAIWQEFGLNPWDADIVKRVLRHKETDSRKLDYHKIIHICQERIRQLEIEEKLKE